MKHIHSYLVGAAILIALFLPSIKGATSQVPAGAPADQGPQVSLAPVASAATETNSPPPAPEPLARHDAPVVAAEPEAATAVGNPSRLMIPAISVDAPIVAMGLEPDGKMAVPDNYTEVGWYQGGARPGDLGAAVMGAHVDNGSWKDGVFKKLKQLAPGDTIDVTDDAGVTRTFEIKEVKTYAHDERDTSSVFIADDKKALRLITCHGTWLPDENTYDTRLIVFAELVE